MDIIEEARWVVTADQHVGRLLRLDRTPTGQVRVTVEDEIHASRGGLQRDDQFTRGDESGRKRFALEIAVWLERLAENRRIERLNVFAPSQFLTVLREAWSTRLAMRVKERDGDLMDLPTRELPRHDLIASLLAANHT